MDGLFRGPSEMVKIKFTFVFLPIATNKLMSVACQSCDECKGREMQASRQFKPMFLIANHYSNRCVATLHSSSNVTDAEADHMD